jgi:hypothetical protein
MCVLFYRCNNGEAVLRDDKIIPTEPDTNTHTHTHEFLPVHVGNPAHKAQYNKIDEAVIFSR